MIPWETTARIAALAIVMITMLYNGPLVVMGVLFVRRSDGSLGGRLAPDGQPHRPRPRSRTVHAPVRPAVDPSPRRRRLVRPVLRRLSRAGSAVLAARSRSAGLDGPPLLPRLSAVDLRQLHRRLAGRVADGHPPQGLDQERAYGGSCRRHRAGGRTARHEGCALNHAFRARPASAPSARRPPPTCTPGVPRRCLSSTNRDRRGAAPLARSVAGAVNPGVQPGCAVGPALTAR